MDYNEQLKQIYEKHKSLVCLGLDPVIEEIPLTKGSISQRIINFYEEILGSMVRKKIFPAAVKPNYAFYAQYGLEGISALHFICKMFKEYGFPVILDVKRGDIGKTASAYSKEAFEFFNADSVTLSPMLGFDSIEPFIKNFPGKGYYILNKTSNKSSGEIQDLKVNGKPLYIYISKKIVEWHAPCLGAVIGATYPEQLDEISDIFIKSGKEIPLLIPGIGAQGGSIKDIMKTLKKYPDFRIHRINSSSGINYAYKKYTNMNFSDAAVKALEILNIEINNFI